MRYVIICHSEKSSKKLEELLKKVRSGEEEISTIAREDNVVVVDTVIGEGEELEEFEEEEMEETF